MKLPLLPLLATLVLPACRESRHEQNSRRANELGEQLVEAVRQQDAAFIHQHLDPRWAGEMSQDDLAEFLDELRRRDGSLEAPALTDLSLLSAEDLEGRPHTPQGDGTQYEYYAAMLTDGSGNDETEGVDARLRLSLTPDTIHLFEWNFEALTTE